MEHRIFGKKLGRNHNQRKALLNGLARGMFIHGAIQTTEAKAKACLRLVEKLTQAAAIGDLQSRRELFRYLQDQKWVNRVVTGIQQAFADQKSNFVTVTKIKRRQGDDAVVVRMAFVKPVTFTQAPVAESPKKESKAKTKPKAIKPKVVKTAKPKETK